VADDTGETNKCPICKKATVADFRPFCSKRCANVDLFNWLKGEYAIPGDEGPSDEEFDPFGESPQAPKSH
jgi:Uncharacterized protein conserved in bacteria